MHWPGQTVLVTGAGAGIGREFARQLHAKGAHIVAVSLVQSELESLTAELGAERLVTLALDLTANGAAAKLLAGLDERGLATDVLINNAGYGLMGGHLDLDEARVHNMLTLNMLALTDLCTLLGRRMRERKRGAILNVASTTAFQPLPYLAAYGASKHYVLAFSEGLAEELAPDGVRVTTLCPGTTRTAFLVGVGLDVEHAKPGSLSQLAGRVAMPPSEVAAAGIRGLERDARLVVPGGLNKLHHAAARIMSERLVGRVAYRLFHRPAR